MIDIPCVIFAGGKSSRMGKDKALLPFGGFDTLTEFQLQRLQKLFKTVYISCKSKEKFNLDAHYIEDIASGGVYAPTTGFIAIFDALKEDAFFALSVDAPFVDEDTISKLLIEDSKELDACIAQTDSGIQPMCGIYHRSLQNSFVKMLQEDNHKLGFLLKNSNTKFVHSQEDKKFLNLNNPQEYEEALQLI